MKKKNNFTIDFIGIGATKSGTTWIANMLAKHPDICLSEPKEVRYFNHVVESRENTEWAPNVNHTKPLSWYKMHFAHCREKQLKGEFSPIYLTDETTAAEIKKSHPEVKLIVCLRNPIDRAYSHYWMMRSYLKTETRSFEEAINGKNIYLRAGFYYKKLSRYFELFNKDQIKIVLFDNITENNEAVLKDIFAFLEVKDLSHILASQNKSNSAKEARWTWVAGTLSATTRFLVHMRLIRLLRFLKGFGAHRFIMNILTKRIEYPKMRKETRGRLFAIYQEDVRQLEQLIGRDLSSWKQDGE